MRYQYHKPRRKRFRSNDKGFRRNGSKDLSIGATSNTLNNFQRKFFRGNGYNAEKLLEQYNNLAKEAFSSGDKILSESYYQHADHFLRVIENRNSIQNNSKTHLDNAVLDRSSGDKIINEDETNSSSQQKQTNEETKI